MLTTAKPRIIATNSQCLRDSMLQCDGILCSYYLLVFLAWSGNPFCQLKIPFFELGLVTLLVFLDWERIAGCRYLDGVMVPSNLG